MAVTQVLFDIKDIPEHLRKYFYLAPQIGLEPTPEEYVTKMVEVFSEVRRVLHPAGTLWLNLGDSYNGSGTYLQNAASAGLRMPLNGAKPKDLCMIPWRVFLALQAVGWWLRSLICWAKKSPMPESVTDRPTSSWEPIALLTKGAKYFYDAEAVKEFLESDPDSWGRHAKKDPGLQAVPPRPMFGPGRNGRDGTEWGDGIGRNMRNVWHLGPEPYPDAHFATFPTEIPRRAIKAGTSEHGCCPKCLAPYRRIIDPVGKNGSKLQGGGATGDVRRGPTVHSRTIGWEPTCKCNAGQPVPCRVLDPFFGSGTTGEVAQELGCECIGIELNPSYIELAAKRFKQRTFLVGA